MRIGWTAAWASMASIACVAACGGGASRARPADAARAAPPARFRPAPGTRMFECPDPPVSRICLDGEVEDCEEACGDGDATSCLAHARWHVRDAGKGGSRARGVELLGLSCRLGSLDGCYRLVTEHGKEAARRDVAAAYAALEKDCARDPACGCARFGSALTLDPRRDREGIALIDAACVRGVLGACDEANLLEEICGRGDRSGVCDVLRRQGRLRPWEGAEPQWQKVRLPAELTGCFRVAVEVRHPHGVGLWGDGSGLDPERDVPTPGTVYCLANDRYYVRAPGGAWDQVEASWSATPDGTELRNDGEGGLKHLFVKKGERLAADDARAGRLERLPPREAKVAARETSAQPRVEEVCRRAVRRAETSRWGYDGHVPVTLRGCLALEQHYAGEAERDAAEGAETPPGD